MIVAITHNGKVKKWAAEETEARDYITSSDDVRSYPGPVEWKNGRLFVVLERGDRETVHRFTGWELHPITHVLEAPRAT